MIDIINEYILVINNGEIFRVYAPNEKIAINTFVNACRTYTDTDNKHYQEHWNNLIKLINHKQYKIIKSEDFMGIRKIT